MISDKVKLCMGCMAAREDDGDECPRCGYNENSPHSINCLPPRTMLTDRYLVGKALSMNGESITYLGYNLETNQKVWIREFMPTTLCDRNQTDNSLTIRSGSDTQYKTMLADFYDLAKMFMRLASTNNCVFPVLELLQKNNTLYVIMQYVKVISIGDFLTRGGGELTWGQAKKLLMPLCNGVANLHKAGVLHRAISPENVYIDQTGKLWLSNFSLPELRTEHSCLEPELYPGYTAPEQYSPNGWQGTWTDVYGLAALFYKMLTGTMPPDAVSRSVSDNLCPAAELNSSVPQNVSDAIRDAMQITVELRTQTVDEFTAQLLESAESNTTVYTARQPSSPGERNFSPQPKQERKKKEPKKGSNRTAFYVIVSLAVTTVVLGAIVIFVVYNLFWSNDVGENSSSSQSQTESSQTESTVTGETVPSFIGMLADKVLTDENYLSKYTFTEVHEYNEDYPEGYIFNQSPANGLEAPGGRVTLYISDGSELVKMPPVVGSEVENAKKLLEERGIKYQVIGRMEEDYRPGIVEEASVEEGVMVKRSETVFLYVRSESLSSSSEEEKESSSSSSYGIVVID